MAKKLIEIKEEDLRKVNLPFLTQSKIILKTIPYLLMAFCVFTYEVVLTLLKMPGDVVDMLTLEESLKVLMKDD